MNEYDYVIQIIIKSWIHLRKISSSFHLVDQVGVPFDLYGIYLIIRYPTIIDYHTKDEGHENAKQWKSWHMT